MFQKYMNWSFPSEKRIQDIQTSYKSLYGTKLLIPFAEDVGYAQDFLALHINRVIHWSQQFLQARSSKTFTKTAHLCLKIALDEG